MNQNRIVDYLDHIQQAAIDACSFIEGLQKEDFFSDKKTQQAIIMSLIIIGEAATKLMDNYVHFTEMHSTVPWRSMRGMRNRIAYGYFAIDLEMVWETVKRELPELLKKLPEVRKDAETHVTKHS